MTSTSRTAPKLCGRCESFFPNLKSRTCPQCFAPLVELTEEEAQRAVQAISSLVEDPELREINVQEDERFKEQSFGACLTVLAVLLLVAVLSIIFIVVASRGKQLVPAAISVRSPVTGASTAVNLLLPPELGGAARISIAAVDTLPNTSIELWQATYAGTTEVYMAPSPRLTDAQRSALQFAGDLVAQQHSPPLAGQLIQTRSATYLVLTNGYLASARTAHALVELKH